MTKVLKSVLLAVVGVVGLVSTVSATLLLTETEVLNYSSLGYGVYLGTFAGNDNPQKASDFLTVVNGINSSIYYNGDDVDLESFAKVDEPAVSNALMSLTYAADKKTGTWSTSEPVDFYTVKATNNFSIWWRDGGATTGNWTTDGIRLNKTDPEISHLSTWNDNNTSTVPEPTTMVLLGMSLLSIGFLAKRKK